MAFYRIAICSVLLGVFVGSEACTYYRIGLSAAQEWEVLNAHRNYRNRISNGAVPGQPRGINLKQMVYDKNLAQLARKVSVQCKFEHLAVSDSRWPAVGQNLYMLSTTDTKYNANWTNAVEAWFSEYKYFIYPDKNIDNKVTGHYTQVVWANTDNLGCDYIMFRDDNDPSWYHHMYTCNYGPAGNYVGQAPYKI